MPETKESLRRTVQTRLKAIGAGEHSRLSALAVQRLLLSPAVSAAKVIAAYSSTDSEADTSALLAYCLNSEKTLALPRTERDAASMKFHRVTNLQSDLEARHFKIREPLAALPVIPPGAIDLIIVPGVAFDAKGNRLGRGAGYYDRYLAQPELTARRVSLAFDCQIVDSVPTLDHDCGVDAIFTESREIVCN